MPAEAGAARTVERVETFTDEDLHLLCEATHAAILDGGGFGWVDGRGLGGPAGAGFGVV